jgi:hypothetical protein
MKNARYLLPAVLVLVIAVSGGATADSKKNICVVDRAGGTAALNTFVFQDIYALSIGRASSLRGFYFSSARHAAPLDGSAVMASDGRVRIGVFVHSSADSTNDFTLSGVTDSLFAGTLSFDNDGDFRPNGTLVLESVNCGTIAIP